MDTNKAPKNPSIVVMQIVLPAFWPAFLKLITL
jgi:hypothetical protein